MLRLSIALLIASLALAGCGASSAPDPAAIAQAVQATVAAVPQPDPVQVEVTRVVEVEVTRVVEVEATRVVEVQITPTPSSRFSTPGDIVTALQAAGLEAVDPVPMTKDDYGLAPLLGVGVRFLIPSLCSDCGGRAFIGQPEQIQQLRAYYDSLAQSSAVFFSWVFVTPDGRAMIQINGDLPEDQARRYQAVLENAN